MRYKIVQPPPSLTSYVRFFWILEAEVMQGTDFVYRSMADGGAELLFHYYGVFDEVLPGGELERSFYAGIHAQSRRTRRFVTQQSFGIFGVYLYPFALPLLCNASADCLSDEMQDLIILFGNEGRQLEEQMMLAPGNKERIKIITTFLERKLVATGNVKCNVTEVIRLLIHSRGQLNVQQLAAQSFLSVRQFERKFKAAAGFSPKLYLRILRFQEAVRQFPGRNKSLAAIAYDCGYADQSHFIHDFKEFSGGHHPSVFFKGGGSDISAREML